MKKIVKQTLAVCIVCILAISPLFGIFFNTSAAKTGKTLKVLAIGNSFSEDALRHLYQIAVSAGATDIVLANLYIGGCDLTTHWNNARNNAAAYSYQKNTSGAWSSRENTTMEYGIKDEDWDVITLQQASGKSGLSSTYNSDIDNLLTYINSKKTNSAARIGWHMTWAYQGNSNHSDFPNYNNNQMTMYNGIVSAVQNNIINNKNINLVIPAGTAVQNMRTSYIGDTLTRDGYHLSLNLGRYIAGLTWFKAITGWAIDNIVYVPSIAEIPPELLPAIKEAVNNAVTTPFAVTPSTYTTAPPNETPYKSLDWQPDGLGYWNSGNGGYAANPQISRGAGLGLRFVPSAKRFTKADIPVGSVIEIDAGYQYRPEGWAYEGTSAPGRPDNVTTKRVVVDDAWWGSYEYRAFNVAVVGSNTDLTGKEQETASHFRINVPRKALSEKSITKFSINGKDGVLSGNAITVTLEEGVDVTKLAPQITVSDGAVVSPAGGEITDFTNPVVYTVTASDGSKQDYIVMIHLKKVYNYSGYHQLDWAPTGVAYWLSGNGGYSENSALVTTADNSKYFVASGKRFTKNDIPVGSVLVIDPGYQYRPEGWGYQGKPEPGRPGNVTEERIVVDEGFWENYEYRAFNVAVAGADKDLTGKAAETASHFRIYIPKSSEKDITKFMIGNVEGIISGTNISITLAEGTDVTKLSPALTISDKATVSPSSGAQTDFTKPVTYTVTAEDGSTKEYTVTVTVPSVKSSEKDITKFMIDAVQGTISGTNISITLPAGTDVTELTPVLTISDKATISPSSGAQTDFTKPVTYTVTAEDGSTKEYTVTVTVPSVKSSEKDITKFMIGNVEGTISGTNISVTLPAGTDVTKLTPVLTISDKATVSPSSGAQTDFTKPVIYTVTAEDGSTKEYTVTATVPSVKSSEKDITKFMIGTVEGTISGTNISITLPDGTDVAKLSPVLTISDKATVSPSSEAHTDFTKPVTYTVTAEDGSTKEYTVTVKVKDNSSSNPNSSDTDNKPSSDVSKSGNTSADDSGKSFPKTGDSYSIMMLCLFAVSAAVCSVYIIYKKRRQGN